MTDQVSANCLPEGKTLSGFLAEVGATQIEVCACRLVPHDGSSEDVHISPDATADDVAFFGIYARHSSGEVSVLHDMDDLTKGASVSDALAEARDHAIALNVLSRANLPLFLPEI